MPPRDKDGPPASSNPSSGENRGGAAPPASSQSRRPAHHITWFVPGKSTLTDAERRAAQTALQSEFPQRRNTHAAGEGKTDHQPTTPVPFLARDTEKPVDLVRFLNGVLSDLGFSPVGRRSYDDNNDFGFRENRRSDGVELCLGFETRGRIAYYLKATCYLTHRPAEQFADTQMLMVLPAAYERIFAETPVWMTILNHGLGGDAGWAPDHLLVLHENSIAEIACRIEAVVKTYVEPKFGAIDTLEALYEFLLDGREPFPWNNSRLRVKLGSPQRVAMVAYLGRRIGVAAKTLKDALLPHVGVFKSPPYARAPSSEEYMDLVLANADRAITLGE